MKSVTIGTANGIIFSFLLGCMISLSIAEIYANSTSSKAASRFSLIIALFYMLVVAGSAFYSLAGVFAEYTGGRFYIGYTEGKYQRAAILMLFQFLISCILYFSLTMKKHKKSKLFSVIYLTLLVISAGSYATISQYFGSNSGPVTITISFLCLVFCIRIRKNIIGRDFDSIEREISFGVLFRRLTREIMPLLFLVVISSLLIGLIFDFSNTRMFGFDSAETNSFVSRLEAFQINFIQQLSENPYFGHTQAHLIYSKDGAYAHSLLSIATHLGLFGFIFFFVACVNIFIDLINKRNKRINIDDIYMNRAYDLFRMIFLFSFLSMSLISSFYTWMPLWFAFGVFGISFIFKPLKEEQKNKVSLNER